MMFQNLNSNKAESMISIYKKGREVEVERLKKIKEALRQLHLIQYLYLCDTLTIEKNNHSIYH